MKMSSSFRQSLTIWLQIPIKSTRCARTCPHKTSETFYPKKRILYPLLVWILFTIKNIGNVNCKAYNVNKSNDFALVIKAYASPTQAVMEGDQGQIREKYFHKEGLLFPDRVKFCGNNNLFSMDRK